MKISLKARIIVKDDSGRYGGGEFEIPIGALDDPLSHKEMSERVKAAIKRHFTESPLTISE